MAATRIACLPVASGQDAVTGTLTVATGLGKVTAVVATLDSDAADAGMYCSATIGDQAGSPAAGSIILKVWKTADGSDPTPVAATAAKNVNWIAVGI